jgi:hypothetical protein
MGESGRDGSPDEPNRMGAAGSLAPVAPSSDGRVTSLSAALRRARLDNAERSEVVANLRAAEIVRLEILRDQLEPVLAQLPKDCDLFDAAISPGERPRLFIDAIGFVEMAPGGRVYRFVQDTRHGRIEVCQNEKTEALVEAITAYIAHRLIEREKALATDFASGGAGAAGVARAAARVEIQRPQEERRGGFGRRALAAYLLLIEFLAAALTLGLLAVLGLWLWRNVIGR